MAQIITFQSADGEMFVDLAGKLGQRYLRILYDMGIIKDLDISLIPPKKITEGIFPPGTSPLPKKCELNLYRVLDYAVQRKQKVYVLRKPPV